MKLGLSDNAARNGLRFGSHDSIVLVAHSHYGLPWYILYLFHLFCAEAYAEPNLNICRNANTNKNTNTI